MSKDREYQKLINTTKWLRLRRAVLTAHPLCQRCEKEGRVTAATEVHHVVPVEDAIGGTARRQLMYDPRNLQALCHACHVKTHTEIGHGGKKGTKRRNDMQVAEAVRRFFGED